MGTKYFCDGCGREQPEPAGLNPSLTPIVISYRDVTGSLKEVVPRFELCAQCLPQFKENVEAYKRSMKAVAIRLGVEG